QRRRRRGVSREVRGSLPRRVHRSAAHPGGAGRNASLGAAPAAVTLRREDRIIERIRAIPEGFVRTYGDIDPRAPRFVGLVLSETDEDLPWQRVVRAEGSVAKGEKQRQLLLREGVPMRGDRVDMNEARFPTEF